MLDLKRIRENPQELISAMKNRGKDAGVTEFLSIESTRRELIAQIEQKKSKRNDASKLIPQMKQRGEDAVPLLAEMKTLADEIKAEDTELAAIEEHVSNWLLTVPNIPHDSVPIGPNDSANVEIRRINAARDFGFPPKAHWTLGEDLGILDFQTGAKVSGARFTFYKGLGAKLERAIINLFLDTHAESGYTEIFPPFMVNRASMIGTGQLPKFEEDAFRVANNDMFLIPTAEVPVTNMYRDMILDGAQLPILHCAYSACFRAEAGAAGRDTRGLIRQHQFNKVELVKFTRPEDSYEHLESLTLNAQKVLDKLGFAYRVVTLSTGDMGFSSAKTYDIEVWMPSYNRYFEISSCSNFEDFQARRAGIRFRDGAKDRARFVHTLNGSGVAVGRTVAAILENYQQEDGSIALPEALWPYMGVKSIPTRAKNC